MLTPFQIETWALQVIERVQNKEQLEYSRVELKKIWIDPVGAARRLAAHANGARGDPILWLVGVDETNGVVGAGQSDLATWWPAVAKEFSEVAPSVVDVVATPPNAPSIVALCFDTSRYPFVVRNPAYGKGGGGPVALEVPWRDGTTTRSATRGEIMLMLSGLVRVPQVKVLAAQIDVVRVLREHRGPQGLDWRLQASLYFLPHGETVIPLHDCNVTLTRVGEIEALQPRNAVVELRASSTLHVKKRPPSPSPNVIGTAGELILKGPGLVDLAVTFESRNFEAGVLEGWAFVADFSFTPAMSSNTVSVRMPFRALTRGSQMEGIACYGLDIPAR
jgi:hypothetical protein